MSTKATCGSCKSDNVFGMSRVVGYYSIIENWNESKKAELVDRQKGVYKFEEKAKIEESGDIKQEEPIAVAAR
ncbi:hypothetical protein GOV08_02880 [Candidatus Woesearchaeota archaeon]|nr:hypothetical protein [Candidatus Woesearchaeota archaeon]